MQIGPVDDMRMRSITSGPMEMSITEDERRMLDSIDPCLRQGTHYGVQLTAFISENQEGRTAAGAVKIQAYRDCYPRAGDTVLAAVGRRTDIDMPSKD